MCSACRDSRIGSKVIRIAFFLKGSHWHLLTQCQSNAILTGAEELQKISFLHRRQEVKIRRNPLPCNDCRRQDLNLHDLYGHQALNLACLPIPPLRRVYYLTGLPIPRSSPRGTLPLIFLV
jgi:hypothetical protein